MIAIRTKLLGPGEEVPVTAERTHQVAAEAVLDTGEGFKITVYLDSNGDYTITRDGPGRWMFGTERLPESDRITGRWK